MNRLMTRALMLAAPMLIATPALAAENLACIASGYSAEQTTAMDTYAASVDFRALADMPVPIATIIEERARTCAATHSWSAQAQTSAISYYRGAVLQRGLRANSLVTPEKLTEIDVAIDASDQAQLRRTMQRLMLFARREGPGPDAADIGIIMPILAASGLAMSNETGTFIGAWIAARISAQDTSRDFLTQ